MEIHARRWWRAVVRDEELLLVHHAYGAKKWQIPGGYVKPDECAHEGVVREIYEETRIHAEVDGLLGVRHRVKEGDNSTYLIFRMSSISLHDPIPDGREVDCRQLFYPSGNRSALAGRNSCAQSLGCPICSGRNTTSAARSGRPGRA